MSEHSTMIVVIVIGWVAAIVYTYQVFKAYAKEDKDNENDRG